jgi:hypothetical protein
MAKGNFKEEKPKMGEMVESNENYRRLRDAIIIYVFRSHVSNIIF